MPLMCVTPTLLIAANIETGVAAYCGVGAASIGVIRVDDMQQLHKAYEKVVRDLSRAKVRPSGDTCHKWQPNSV
jgi:hypothetical protein